MFLPWWDLKAYAGWLPCCLLSFTIIPTELSPRIMVWRLRIYGIYRCSHVNSKWVLPWKMRVQSPINECENESNRRLGQQGQSIRKREFINQSIRNLSGIPDLRMRICLLSSSNRWKNWVFVTSKYFGYNGKIWVTTTTARLLSIPWLLWLLIRKWATQLLLLSNVLCGYFTLSNWREFWSKLRLTSR